MRKIIFTALICLMTAYTYSQNPSTTNPIGKSFVTSTEITVVRYNAINKQKVIGSNFILGKDTRFFIYDIVEDGYIISVWNFLDPDSVKANFYESLRKGGAETMIVTPPTTKGKRYQLTKPQLMLSTPATRGATTELNHLEALAYVDSWANNMQFFIPFKEFTTKCETIYPKGNSFTWGFLTLPIKARFGNAKAPFAFEEKVNFGLTFGWKRQFASRTYTAGNLLVGVSVSNVKIDDTNSQPALSFSTGYMFQYDKFQMGLFTGLDFTNQLATKWPYQGKPWLGFAIGLSLFGEGNTARTSQTQ
jgi:hypothetical protein